MQYLIQAIFETFWEFSSLEAHPCISNAVPTPPPPKRLSNHPHVQENKTLESTTTQAKEIEKQPAKNDSQWRTR